MSIFIRKRKRLTFSHFLFFLCTREEKKSRKKKEEKNGGCCSQKERKLTTKQERTLVITLNVNGYSRPVSKRVVLSLFIFFFSPVIGEGKKKDFLLLLIC
jgi:hypothetical protein